MDSANALAALQEFLKRATEVGPGIVTALLFQCPRSLRVDTPQAQAIAAAIAESKLNCKVALEVRNDQCFADHHLQAESWVFALGQPGAQIESMEEE